MPSVKVRVATMKDLPGIMRLEAECFDERRFEQETVTAFVVRNDTIALVAVDERMIVGAAMCMFSKRCGEGRIASIAVMDGRREKGLASRLLIECEKRMMALGVRRCGLEVGIENTPAISLYLKHGYVLKTMAKDYYGAKKHAYLMEKSISKG
ncbi:MAG: GNAT family N-acetyltransferase, partial [Thermoplasmata archaeon]|nr:GNAT family N-acetyltransferase [Thermoplasmata archaeon]